MSKSYYYLRHDKFRELVTNGKVIVSVPNNFKIDEYGNITLREFLPATVAIDSMISLATIYGVQAMYRRIRRGIGKQDPESYYLELIVRGELTLRDRAYGYFSDTREPREPRYKERMLVDVRAVLRAMDTGEYHLMTTRAWQPVEEQEYLLEVASLIDDQAQFHEIANRFDPRKVWFMDYDCISSDPELIPHGYFFNDVEYLQRHY